MYSKEKQMNQFKNIFFENLSTSFFSSKYGKPETAVRYNSIDSPSCHVRKLFETENCFQESDSYRRYFASKSPGHNVTLTSFTADLWHARNFICTYVGCKIDGLKRSASFALINLLVWQISRKRGGGYKWPPVGGGRVYYDRAIAAGERSLFNVTEKSQYERPGPARPGPARHTQTRRPKPQ